ncbi:MAG: glycosyltransferase family 4 protein [Phycisphaeraceae bacterium]
MSQRHLAITCLSMATDTPAGEHAQRLASGMFDRGWRVSVLCAYVGEHDLDERIAIIDAGMGPPRSAVGIAHFRYWHERQRASIKPDRTLSLTTLVPAGVVLPLSGTAEARRTAIRQIDAPLPVRAGAWARSLLPGSLAGILAERRSLTNPITRFTAAASPVIESQLVAQARADRDRVVRVDPPVIVEPLAVGERDALRAQLSRGLGLRRESQWLVFPFRAGRSAGTEAMLLGFRDLIDRGGDAVLLIAGPLRYTHLAWIAELGLRDRVRVVGVLDHPAELFAAADLVVQPAAYDPGGWAVRLATAVSTPAITTTVSGAADRVRESGGAVIELPVDPSALADAMRALLGTSTDAPRLPTPATTPDASDASPEAAYLDDIAALLDDAAPFSSP